MLERGIVGPVKVVRAVLENAASVAEGVAAQRGHADRDRRETRRAEPVGAGGGGIP